MDLTQRFRVAGDPDVVFRALLDLEQVAACMPGAEMTGRDDDRYLGRVKLRLGPIAAAYEGSVVFESVDESLREARLLARGSETQGQGSASASIAANVTSDDAASIVNVETTLDVQGKAAQFGRGVLADVSGRLLDQFAANLEALLSQQQEPPEGGRPEADVPPSQVAVQPSRPVAETRAGESSAELDVLAVVVLPWLRRLAPVLTAGAVGVCIGWLLGRGRNRGGLQRTGGGTDGSEASPR